MGAEVAAGAVEQVEYLRGGATGLGDEIDEFRKVAAEEQIRGANGVEGLDEPDFAECVHRGLAAAHVGDFNAMEQIQAAGEGTARPPGGLGHRGHFAVTGGEPSRDEAGITPLFFADENGLGLFHGVRPVAAPVRER